MNVPGLSVQWEGTAPTALRAWQELAGGGGVSSLCQLYAWSSYSEFLGLLEATAVSLLLAMAPLAAVSEAVC